MTSAAIREKLAAFQALSTDMFEKDFLLTWEHPVEEIRAILDVVRDVMKIFDFPYSLEISTRPDKDTIGSEEDW